jgi:CheY-like chemotaxis protein
VLLQRTDSHLEVSVTDTGHGIKAEFLPHVFDRFQQADSTTTRRYGGLGLGLAIVRNLVELHGGTVRAQSPGEGQGATFTVSLPVMAVRAEPDKAKRSATEKPAPDAEGLPDISGLRILAVDDEPDSLAIITRLLQLRGCNVETAASGAEAIQTLQKQPFDVLISDIGMPDEDGYAFLKKVRALPASRGGNIPAIALTAFTRSEDRRRAMLAGFQMHVSKPADSAELIAVIANVTGRT